MTRPAHQTSERAQGSGGERVKGRGERNKTSTDKASRGWGLESVRPSTGDGREEVAGESEDGATISTWE